MVLLKKSVTLHIVLSPTNIGMINAIIEKNKNFERAINIQIFLALCIKEYLKKHNIPIPEIPPHKPIGRTNKRFREILKTAKPIKLKEAAKYDRDEYYSAFDRLATSVSLELQKLGEIPEIKKYTVLGATDFLTYFVLHCYRDIVIAECDDEELVRVDQMLDIYEKEVVEAKNQGDQNAYEVGGD